MLKKGMFAILLAGVLTAGLVWWLRGTQQTDTAYTPRVEKRTFERGGPAIAIDDAHWNAHTAARGYAPFTKLLLADGYTVIERGNVASSQVLAGANVVVIANPLGFRGVVRQFGQIVRIDLDALVADAFSDPEIDQLDLWVRNGGSLLLAADHAPAGRAAQSLAERFGVTMRDRFVFDPEHSEPGAPSVIVFTRESRLLGAHPIIGEDGRQDSINRVVTLTGQALDGPVHASRLLMFSGTAYELPRSDSLPEERTPVPGLAQALAMEHGRGRVVILGEATVLTSQVVSDGRQSERIGLQRANSDNELFARRIMAWLSHAVE
jgi:hypothetical protein